MALYSLDYLDELRRRELALVLGRTRRWFEGARILEIGAGDGAQLQILRTIGAQAIGVDMPNSAYATARRTGIVDFDGKALPFADHVFDVVYSSNVMQNVVEEPPLHREMRRVLRADGVAIHVVPSAHWRVLTSLAHYAALPALVTRAARHYLRHAATGNGKAASPPSGVSRPSVWQHFFGFLVCPRLGERGTWATEWWHFTARAWVAALRASVGG